MQNLQQFVLQGRLMMLSYEFVNVAQQGVKAISLLNCPIHQVHHPPIQLHLLLQVPFQTSYEVIHSLQPILNQFRVDSFSHVHLFFSLYPSLPFLLLVIDLIRLEMHVHLADVFVLLFQDLKALLVGPVALEVLQTISIGIAIEPLKQYNVIVKFTFADLLKRQRLSNFQLFQRIFDELDVSIIVLRVFCVEVQLEDVDGARVNGVDHLGVGDSVTECLDCCILCLHLPVYPLKQLVPSHIHPDLNYRPAINSLFKEYCQSQLSFGLSGLLAISKRLHPFVLGVLLDPSYDAVSSSLAVKFVGFGCFVLSPEFKSGEALNVNPWNFIFS